MVELIQANWLAFVVVLLIGLLVAWWLFGRATKEPPRTHRPDVLDEGAEPAKRNQALIDSAPAATFVPPSGTATMGGVGEVVSAAAHEEAVDAEPAGRKAQVPEATPATPESQSAAEQDPGPEPASPASPESPVEAGDDLSRLKGVGPKLVAHLHGMGITRYSQIAGWSDEDIDRIDADMGAFKGRIRRDNWVEQARFLASGDTSGYEAKFGKL
ncbi:hypothetical protein GCM10011371_30160 [Novosphingobium marinum]|uniref:Putative flap endonuclease-1-like 5' DNA nuclease n=1 Tax=Novosphingobium marinum TaxID=1514948 RepID=A0A7Z0BSK5_9SPHN|nr:hypothetical protein [Novosphingobium marinum]NYH95031.1 putative flap endonuclease-1-like 5' DNA nuclease [Novosphingobium marinum]GGC40706.1 hypothetical protein GCM10011371_30160 [Novosphingobium marinum]